MSVPIEESKRRSVTSAALRMIPLWSFIFLLITLAEAWQAAAAPTVLTNMLGGPISVVVWAVLSGWFTAARRASSRGRDRLAIAGWAVLLGGVSGFVGAFAGWWIYQAGLGPPAVGCCPGFPLPDRWFRDSGGLTYWPIVAAVTCAIVALVGSGGRSGATSIRHDGGA